MSDPFDLDRFVSAQAMAYDQALGELREGRKRSHWMWFIFPQLRGLGLSQTAQHFGISGLDEARAYLAHPLLGPRLRASVEAVLAVEGRTLHDIFGSPDDLKFVSSMTLFHAAAADDSRNLFDLAIARLCHGQPDARTVSLLNG